MSTLPTILLLVSPGFSDIPTALTTNRMKVQIQGNKSARYQDTWLSLLMNCSSYSNTPPIEHKFCAAKNLFCQVHHLNYFVKLDSYFTCYRL